jgi:hypothetical protein
MKNLFTALVNFQAECPVVQKDDENPHFKSKFASILSMKGTIQPLLHKHGLAVLQFPIGNGDGTETGCRTVIVHTSGESIEADFLIPIGDRIDAQKACAAVSYARRFALSGALGLVTAEDVDQDGNDLAAPEPKKRKKAAKKTAKNGVVSQESQEAADEYLSLRDAVNVASKHIGIGWTEAAVALGIDPAVKPNKVDLSTVLKWLRDQRTSLEEQWGAQS